MTITKATYPVAPVTTPRKGTLLDAATVTDDFKWLDGNALFDSYNCMKFESTAAFCAPSPKTFQNSMQWVSGIRFAAYGGVMCKAIGLNQAHMLSEVERVFALGESTAVERALMSTRFVDDPTPSGDRWTAPVDVNPAGAVSVKTGIALLEGYAANSYVGVPTLHVPVSIASLVLAVDGAEYVGNTLFTKTGSKMVAGAGYDYPNTSPTGAAAAAGEKWIYATGEVIVTKSEAVVKPAMAYDTNEVYVLGERAYIAAVDCFVAAVRVTVG
jgi:hypothetical protein